MIKTPLLEEPLQTSMVFQFNTEIGYNPPFCLILKWKYCIYYLLTVNTISEIDFLSFYYKEMFGSQ